MQLKKLKQKRSENTWFPKMKETNILIFNFLFWSFPSSAETWRKRSSCICSKWMKWRIRISAMNVDCFRSAKSLRDYIVVDNQLSANLSELFSKLLKCVFRERGEFFVNRSISLISSSRGHLLLYVSFDLATSLKRLFILFFFFVLFSFSSLFWFE